MINRFINAVYKFFIEYAEYKSKQAKKTGYANWY